MFLANGTDFDNLHLEEHGVSISMKDVYRGIVCRCDVYSGQDVLDEGFDSAHRLYNFIIYCTSGYNHKLAKARGCYSLAGRLPKYPRFVGMWRALKDDDFYKALSERVSNYIVRNLDSYYRAWFKRIKTNPKARPPKYLGKNDYPQLTFEAGYGRNAKYLGNGYWRLSVLPGRVENRYAVVRVYLPPLTNPDRVECIFLHKDGKCAVSYKLRTKESTGNSVAAIDLGVSRIATVAFDSGDSIMYHSGEILSQYRYTAKVVARCKPSGYNGKGFTGKAYTSARSKEIWKTCSRRVERMIHSISDSIIRESRSRGVGTIVIGDLTGIKTGKDYGDATNQKIQLIPFMRLSDMITYKAEEVGIEVVKISEKYTSQTCMICGNRDKNARVNRGLYVCRNCGARIHADVNGAFNILKKYLPTFEFGVAGDLSTLPSPTAPASGYGKVVSQIDPTFVAKIDLRDNSVHLQRIARKSHAVAEDSS